LTLNFGRFIEDYLRNQTSWEKTKYNYLFLLGYVMVNNEVHSALFGKSMFSTLKVYGWTGNKRPLRHFIQKNLRGPQNSPFLTFSMESCKGPCNQRHIFTMATGQDWIHQHKYTTLGVKNITKLTVVYLLKSYSNIIFLFSLYHSIPDNRR
jgi:hypothetical protein